MVYWFATGIGPPAFCYSCYYLWRAGTESQLRSMKLSEDTDVTAFSGVVAGFATLVHAEPEVVRQDYEAIRRLQQGLILVRS